MVHHYQGCTQCDHCRSGWQQLCQEVPVKVYGGNAHGGHARYLKVPANTMVPLPEELSFTAGAAISCGSGTAYGALRRMNVSGRDTIAIFGQGPVGLAGDAVRQGDGRAGDRARHQPAAAGARQGVRRRRAGQSRLQRSRRRDQGTDARPIRRPHARYVEQPRGAPQRHPQHQGLGHDVLRRRRRRGDDRRQPAPAAPADEPDRVLDLLHDHPGRVRRSSASSARSTSTSCSRTSGRSTRRTRPTSCSTSRRTGRASS